MLSTSHQQTKIKPPRKFKSVKGLKRADVVEEPQFAKINGNVRGMKGKGLRYESHVCNYLDRNLPEHVVGVHGLWFKFEDAKGERYAQADWVGFDLLRACIYIVEVKLTRVPDAWWQLNRLYKPLVSKVFGWDIAMIEVTATVRNVAVPDDVLLIHDITKAEPNNTYLMRLPYDC